MKCMSKKVQAEKARLDQERRIAEEQERIAAMSPEEYEEYLKEKEESRKRTKESLLNLARTYSIVNSVLGDAPYFKL